MQKEITLYQHQRDAIGFVFARGGSGALFMDCGTGKTLVALKVFEEMRKTEPALKLIAVMPLSILEAAWGSDIKQFTNLTYYNAHNKKLPKELKEDILLINYEAVILARNSGILNLMRGNMVVCDESSRLKGNTTRTAKFFLATRGLPKYKIVMTATPAPNTPLEYYAQMEFIKPGILHKSFYGFRNSYFHLQRGRQIMSGKLVTRAALFDAMRTGFKYEIAPQNLKKLMTRIEPYIFYARKKDCLDLPDQVDEVRKVTLSATQMRHYYEMKRDLITEIQGEEIVAQVALTKIMKLRELCSGFVINGKKTIELADSAKITELKAVIEEAGDQPIIIWACFHWEIARIVKELGADNCRTFYAKTPDKDASLADFKSGKARFMVAHSASMGHGVTLTNCSMQIFFSLDYSLERYLQGRDRIHRIGQVNKCTYIHIIASGTIEEDILKCLRDKSNMTRIVEEMIR